MLSSVVETVSTPSNVIGLLGLAGLILLPFLRRWGIGLLAGATILLAVFGWSPAGSLALAALENRFPKPAIGGDIDGIIVLGGAVDTHVSAARGVLALNDGAERLTEAAMLALAYPSTRILLSGGLGDTRTGQMLTESSLGRELLIQIGIDPARIELEERSRTTCENARQSKEVAQPQPGEQWLVITSASHMPRAVACFRAADFPVTPYPVDYRTESGAAGGLFRLISSGLQASDLAAHEWIGLAYYRLTQTRELFPAP